MRAHSIDQPSRVIHKIQFLAVVLFALRRPINMIVLIQSIIGLVIDL